MKNHWCETAVCFITAVITKYPLMGLHLTPIVIGKNVKYRYCNYTYVLLRTFHCSYCIRNQWKIFLFLSVKKEMNEFLNSLRYTNPDILQDIKSWIYLICRMSNVINKFLFFIVIVIIRSSPWKYYYLITCVLSIHKIIYSDVISLNISNYFVSSGLTLTTLRNSLDECQLIPHINEIKKNLILIYL